MSRLSLAPSLDTAAAPALHGALLARLEAGEPLLLDGSSVERVGQACLQLLAGARSGAEAASLAYALADPTDALMSMAALARLDIILEPLGGEGAR